MFLSTPDERTKEAFKRLATDPDFSEITAWLDHSLAELDQENRAQLDGILMRQAQGAGQVIAELLAHVRGRNKAIARPMVNTRTG